MSETGTPSGMTAAVFAIPGDIDLPTGGYGYDRRVLALMPACGVAMRYLALPGSFPHPTADDLDETRRLLAAVPPEAVLLADGLAYGALPASVLDVIRAPTVALVHHPLCLEAGLSGERARALEALEIAALARARHVIVTSPATARTLVTGFAIPDTRITVAEPGTDPAERAQGTGTPVQLLSVGAVVPRKALDLLVRALAPLRGHDWRLTLAGPTDRSAPALAALQAAIRETGLETRVTLTGPLDMEALSRHYAAADVFILPSLYEGYGMVLAEAMARGLPIVCTTGGAAAQTVPDEAAIKVPPGDGQALGEAIRRLLEDAGQRRRLADASWAAGQSLPRWETTARSIAAVVREVAP